MNEDLNKLDTFKKTIETFDTYKEYVDEKIERGINEHRKGEFVLKFTDSHGNPINGVDVSINQTSHEFKFGCTLFLLDEFEQDEKNELYREKFKNIFNYAVAPLYWDTLEPQQGKPRFEIGSTKVWRRPALDLIKEYCDQNNIKMKGHCLMYNSFNPNWLPTKRRDLRIEVEKRVKALSERYYTDFIDLDVINEMSWVYKNCYGENWLRNYSITDDKDHEKWCFELAKQYFPHSTLFWNEGAWETFANSMGQYQGDKSVYYLMLKNQLNKGAPIEGIGIQYHIFTQHIDDFKLFYNPIRAFDLFNTYSEFKLPIHMSEVSIPSWSNDLENEQIQAELVTRLFKLWFSIEHMDAIVWWNLVDGTAFGNENVFHAGLLRNDMSEKAAYKAIDNLVNKVWHTELKQKSIDNGTVLFNGFYGDYEIKINHNGIEKIHKVKFHKENTGYNHRTFGLRETKIVID